MSDRWIVTNYDFAQHRSLKIAQREAARLAEKTGKTYRVLRVKDTLSGGETAARIAALEQAQRGAAELLSQLAEIFNLDLDNTAVTIGSLDSDQPRPAVRVTLREAIVGVLPPVASVAAVVPAQAAE